jgi:signal transduction protein with GAF and PtsI domain
LFVCLFVCFNMTTPEKATEYLARVNWKSLVEFMTAEAILNRPMDPVQFCRDILGAKLAERGQVEFRPEQITDWLRNCYTEATALVDEHGVIHGKAVEKSPQSVQEQLIDMRRKANAMQKLLDASRTIATLDPLQATDNIVTETCRILNCDRATIFTLDDVSHELVLCAAEGARNIRVPVGQGIAGSVAATGESINIVDAYSDSRFNSSADQATGYHTTTILCMAISNNDGKIVGVLQAINKKDGQFGIVDEEVMSMLSMQAAIALQNATLFKHAEKQSEKFRALLDMIRAMQGEMGVNSLIFTITQRTPKIIDADRCTLYLVDNAQRALYAMQGEVNIRISMEQGIAGSVATTGNLINITDAYDNPSFNQAVDKKSGYRTKAILCVPIKCEDVTIGVIQLINKMEGQGIFTEEDEEMMQVFLSIAGPILASSHLYQQLQGKGKGKGDNEMPGTLPKQAKQTKPSMSGFAEGEDEEEDA